MIQAWRRFAEADIEAARDEGKVQYLGFSAHTTKAALAAMKGFRFDTVMFPINFVEMFKIGFGKAVLELAEKQGAAVLAIKPMSKGPWPQGVERPKDQPPVPASIAKRASGASSVARAPASAISASPRARASAGRYCQAMV